jgi:hypothetical protein
MTVSETLKKNWIYIAFVIIVIIPLMYVIVSFVMMVNEPSYALVLNELKDSDNPNLLIECCNDAGDFVQKSFVIPLTEEDFEKFPKLASIMRDKNQKPSYEDNEGRPVYQVYISDEEKGAFESQFPGGYLEYKGKRYHFAFLHVD